MAFAVDNRLNHQCQLVINKLKLSSFISRSLQPMWFLVNRLIFFPDAYNSKQMP